MKHPKRWYIPVTSENREELSVWWRKKATESGWISDDKPSLDGGMILLSKHPYDDSYWSLFENSFISRYPSYQKITIEEFREITNTKPKPMKQTFEQLKDQVVNWAESKDLLQMSNHPVQFIKVVEELGELGSAILKSNRQAEIDGFGDVLVTLIILAEQRGINLVKALSIACDEIKGRTGKTIDGVFVKYLKEN